MMKRHKRLLLEPLETRSLFAADLHEFLSFQQSDDHACDVEVSRDLSDSFPSNLSDTFASGRSMERLNEGIDLFGPTRNNRDGRSIRSDYDLGAFAKDARDTSLPIAISPTQRYSVLIVVDPPVVNSGFFEFIGLSSNLYSESVAANVALPATQALATQATTIRTPNAEPVSTSPTLPVSRSFPTSSNLSSGNNLSGNSLAGRPNELRSSPRFASVQTASVHVAVPEGESETKNAQASGAIAIGEKSSISSSDSLMDAAGDSNERPWASADRQRAFAIYRTDEIETLAVIDMLPLEWVESSTKSNQGSIVQRSERRALDPFDEIEFEFTKSALQKHSRSLSFNDRKDSYRLSQSYSDRLLVPTDMVLLDLNDRDQSNHNIELSSIGKVENQEIVLQSGLSPMAIFQIFINEDPLIASTPFDIPNLDFTLNGEQPRPTDERAEPEKVQLSSLSSLGVAFGTTVTLVGVTSYVREYNRRQWMNAELQTAERSDRPFSRKFPK